MGGDGDPLDVILLGTQKERGEVLTAKIVGILSMTDSGEKDDKILAIPIDAYYKDLKHLKMEDREKINFDHPSSFEFDLLYKHLNQIKNNNQIKLPIYDYTTHTRKNE